jgi:DNA-binding Xre family transcriptional regulator
MAHLKILFAKADIKQVEVSKQTGITENRLSQLATGRRIPNLDEAEKLAVALCCSIEEIYSVDKSI